MSAAADSAQDSNVSRAERLQAFAAAAAEAILTADEHALFRLLVGSEAVQLTEAFDVVDGIDPANHGRERVSDEAGEVLFKKAATAVKGLLRTKGVTDLNATADLNGDTCLHYAAKAGHGPVLRFIFNCGLVHDLNACVNSAGDTPLHEAVANQRTSFARQLLFMGADPSAQNKEGRTPKGIARKLNHRELQDILKQGPAGFVCRPIAPAPQKKKKKNP
jgi:ankyrin repeat protein